ncbi:MAG: hypothetical protein EP329_17360 [Deltaproteobacteria bacterium]|nr:MAG: hypothetical protein EP329_17360 [Deltaproteobacteria bacterium]
MRNFVSRGHWVGWVASTAIVACTGADPGDAGPTGHVAVNVAPLSLPGISDATYTLEVVAGAQTVWTKAVTSSAYGDGAGSLSYVGTCDADAGTNTVRLTLDALQTASGTLVDGVDYMNPAPAGSPIELDVDCVENVDTPVEFNLTVARAATQGFFDISVEFTDIFCSAKADCVDANTAGDLHLLTNPLTGARDLTAVIGFACTAGPGASTILLLDPTTIVCDGGGPYFTDVAGGPGNLNPPFPGPTNTTDLIFQASIFRGGEQLAGAGKAYWNVALGLNQDAFSNLGTCVLTAAGTAVEGTTSDGWTPPNTRYPYVSWYVQLTDTDGTFICGANELNGGEAVIVDHTDYYGRPFFASYIASSGTIQVNSSPPDGASYVSCDLDIIPVGRTMTCAITPLATGSFYALGHAIDFSPSAAPSGAIVSDVTPDFGDRLYFDYQAGNVEETVTISPNPGSSTTVDVFETIQLERGFDSASGTATQGYHYACVTALGTPGDADADCVPATYQLEAQWLLPKNNLPGTAPVYSCTRPNETFVTTSATCNGVAGATNAGVVGYIFSFRQLGVTEAERLKLCDTGTTYFMSSTVDCEGHTIVSTLGFALENY